MKRVVFLGASAFGLRCLDAIRTSEIVQIAGVLTVPQTFKISYAPEGVALATYASLSEYAQEVSIPYHLMDGGMSQPEVVAQLECWEPDCMVVCGWYHMLPKKILDIAPAYGLHASLLPDYSGGAPLVWAMIEGEEQTGITLFELADGVDNGGIVAARATQILFDDSIATLYQRIETLGIEMVLENLKAMADGTVQTQPQDESKRRVFPQRSPSDGCIDWLSPAARVHNFVRAQTKPYPGAFTNLRGEKLTIWSCRVVGDVSSEDLDPGTLICSENDSVRIVCGDGKFLELLELGFQGADYSASQWLQHVASSGEGPYRCT